MSLASEARRTRRYDMPIGFGPSLIPDRSEIPHAEVVGLSFLTEADALRALLPEGLDLAGDPVVSVSCIDYRGVDYMGGRGYLEIVVSFPARLVLGSESLTGGYAPVLWVSDFGALYAGREYMGLPKLLATFETSAGEGTRSFACAEYGNRLLEGRATELTPLSDEQLARVRARSQEVRTFGWKHIPSDRGEPDADYPLINVMRWEYTRAWSGRSEIEWHGLDAIAAPFSSRIIAALSRLPILEYKRSFVAEGRAVIDRSATRRVG